MHGLNSGMVKNLALLLPPPGEQAAIVRFLNWANARLERAIRAKRQVIALLNEQKQARCCKCEVHKIPSLNAVLTNIHFYLSGITKIL